MGTETFEYVRADALRADALLSLGELGNCRVIGQPVTVYPFTTTCLSIRLISGALATLNLPSEYVFTVPAAKRHVTGHSADSAWCSCGWHGPARGSSYADQETAALAASDHYTTATKEI